MCLAGALALAPSVARAQARNVKVATFNVQQLSDIANHDDQYYDDNGDPLSDEDRTKLIAERIRKSDVEIIALNEVFDEDSRDLFISGLSADYPFFVAYIGNDWDIEDSGLMLFSKFPFAKMDLGSHHTPEDGDVVIVQSGVKSESPDGFLGFTEFHCDDSYADDPVWDNSDCYATKGAGIVAIEVPGISEPLHVVFSHFVASYGSDDHDLNCAKKGDRQHALHAFRHLVWDAAGVVDSSGEEVFDQDMHYVVAMGDFNIDGNAAFLQNDTCLDAEWQEAFDPAFGTVPFTSCGDLDLATCESEHRVMTDAWAFDTSPDDIGWTAGGPFTSDPNQPVFATSGKRLDYILYRSPTQSLMPGPMEHAMIPQHMTIEWPLTGEQGNMSDHLPVGANILLPEPDVELDHTTPRIARNVAVPFDGSPAYASMEIEAPGQMQWLKLQGSPGTYTVRAITYGQDVAFDIYTPADLSRPIQPRREADRGGFVYLLDDPPYFVRTFASTLGPGKETVHDRANTANYLMRMKRHRCTSPSEACILMAGDSGEMVTWPNQPVNATDTMWFEFVADDADEQTQPFHQFDVQRIFGGALAPFAFSVAEMSDPNVDQTLTWTTESNTADLVSRRTTGIAGSGTTPSHKSWFVKVRRPLWWMFTGVVTVSHKTNLTYWVPKNIRILQENDDSAHDELWIYNDLLGSVNHAGLTQANVHQSAGHFTALPLIDELEDGGAPWPAKSLGQWAYATELPLCLLEDDDEDSEFEEGDFLLADPLGSNAHSTANGFAVATLPLGETEAHVRWKWSDKDPTPSDANDSDYWYEMDFRLTHTPPCLIWADAPCD